MKTSRKLFLHAPGVHVGGGLTLLQVLFSSPELAAHVEQLDARAAHLVPTSAAERHLVRPTLFARLAAEFRLWRRAAKGDAVLCFHGLPPLLHSRGDVTVFLQNRLLLSTSSLRSYPFKTRIRLLAERALIKSTARRVHKFIVQSPSMAAQARAFLGESATVVVCPFMAVCDDFAGVDDGPRAYDFVYVASAEPHKNHRALLMSWCQLAEQGIRPGLALTVASNAPLATLISDLKERWALNITNLGTLTAEEVGRLYGQAGALIYPSLTESLGLPLIEASLRGLPVIAAELDYVRDVVEPVQTFDPHSHTSIARAVKRHLGIVNSPQVLYDPGMFLREVLQ